MVKTVRAIARLQQLFERHRVARRVRGRFEVHSSASSTIGRIIVQGWGKPGLLVLGERSIIEDGAVIQVSNGGVILIGPDVRVRTGAVLNVSGTLELHGQNLVSWNSVVHCMSSVIFEPMAGTGDGVTVVDSTHFHGEVGSPQEHWYHNAVSSPVRIGRNTWLSSKSTVSAGVSLGAASIVAGHAFVTAGDYADSRILMGVPARSRERKP